MFVKASKPLLFPMAAGSSRPQAILPRFYLLLTVALSLVACTSADRQAVISTLNATNAILYGTPTPQSTSRTRTSRTPTSRTRTSRTPTPRSTFRTPTPSTHSQASGAIGQPTDADSREQKQVKRHEARALANKCIRSIRPPGVTALTFFKSRLKNICNYAVTVTFGYNVKSDGTPIQAPWCTVGHAGSIGGSMKLSPGQHKPVAPIESGNRYRVLWCACDKRLAWAAFAEPKGRSADRCTCRCAPN